MKNEKMKKQKKGLVCCCGLIGVMLATGVCAAKEVELLMCALLTVTGVLTQGKHGIRLGRLHYNRYQ